MTRTRKEQIVNGVAITPLTREEQMLAGNALTPITEKERLHQKAYSGSGGGGGGEPLPKVIFDGTIQGQLTGELYIASFEQPLELIPECEYTVIFDGNWTTTTFDYQTLTHGYALMGGRATVSFNTAMLYDDNEHTLKILQNQHTSKQLIYSAALTFVDNGGDNFRSVSGTGHIPNLGYGEYTVIWDNVEYDLQPYISGLTENLNPSLAYLGDPTIYAGAADPEYPFLIDGDFIYTNSTELSHQIAIYGPKVDSSEVVLYAEDNPSTGGVINPVYADKYQYWAFGSVVDIAQFIQNRTPVIVKTLGGFPQSGKLYPISYINIDGESITISVQDGSNTLFFGLTTGQMSS